MKTQSIALQPPRRAGRALFIPRALYRSNSLACLALTLLATAVPAVALVLLTTWATGVPAVLPVAQAAIGLSGFVYLALALDAGKISAALHSLTGIALFSLAWASAAVTPELLIVAAMLMAVWLGMGIFSRFRRNCL